jgi:hypothetical protein
MNSFPWILHWKFLFCFALFLWCQSHVSQFENRSNSLVMSVVSEMIICQVESLCPDVLTKNNISRPTPWIMHNLFRTQGFDDLLILNSRQSQCPLIERSDLSSLISHEYFIITISERYPWNLLDSRGSAEWSPVEAIVMMKWHIIFEWNFARDHSAAW